jgi:uncharacterized protein (DUF305 family)
MTNNNSFSSKRWRIGAAVLTGLITIGALTACTINSPGQTGTGGHNMMNDRSTDPGTSNTETDAEFSSTDIMFAQMMIPHHEQAIEMSTLAETRTTNPELLALASRIKTAQTPEIVQMTTWLDASGTSDMDMGHMGHGMGDMGMLSDAQMTALSDARGAAFDTLYLEGMIQHHLGAIDMAQMILNSANPEVRKLGEDVVSSQQAEVDQMKKMLGQS